MLLNRLNKKKEKLILKKYKLDNKLKMNLILHIYNQLECTNLIFLLPFLTINTDIIVNLNFAQEEKFIKI